jgi:hypothetical protein
VFYIAGHDQDRLTADIPTGKPSKAWTLADITRFPTRFTSSPQQHLAHASDAERGEPSISSGSRTVTGSPRPAGARAALITTSPSPLAPASASSPAGKQTA